MAKDKDNTVTTGEWGWCEECRGPVAVRVTPGDRVQVQLLKAVFAAQQSDGRFHTDPDHRLLVATVELAGMGRLAQSAAARLQGAGVEAAYYERALRESLREAAAALLVAAQALEERGGQPVDVLKDAMEHYQAQTDMPGGAASE